MGLVYFIVLAVLQKYWSMWEGWTTFTLLALPLLLLLLLLVELVVSRQLSRCWFSSSDGWALPHTGQSR